MHTFQASSIAEEYGLFEKKKKLPILKQVLVMRKTGAPFLGEFALRNPFMPLNVLPRGHSARSNCLQVLDYQPCHKKLSRMQNAL
jgi:hypothetical protein